MSQRVAAKPEQQVMILLARRLAVARSVGVRSTVDDRYGLAELLDEAIVHRGCGRHLNTHRAGLARPGRDESLMTLEGAHRAAHLHVGGLGELIANPTHHREPCGPLAREARPAFESLFAVAIPNLVSLLMAQLSESPHLSEVFTDLFDADGASVSMYAYERFTATSSTTFGDLVSQGRELGMVVIGFRAVSAIGKPNYLANGLRVNPPKSLIIDFASGDVVIAISGRF